MARVLVVDDDPLVRGLLVRCLRLAGHRTAEAADGLQAMALLEAGEAYDLVVTDHAMPGATGLQVIETAQRLDPTLPCIVVTAFHDLDLAMQAMEAGAAGFLPKPFRPRHLEAVVARALERRALAKETFQLRLVTPWLERVTLLLANTVEAKDVVTHRHCERLVAYADAIARRLGLAVGERADVRLGACLHDLGKVGVPEELLRAARPLTAAEAAAVRRHAEIGAAILAEIGDWNTVRRIVRHHHERVDGHGYPDALSGAAIPLGARIVAVADAFDVICSGRPYRAARTPEAAVAELERGRGTQFDPDCVEAFCAALADEGSEVIDTAGRAPRVALLVEPHPA